MRVQRMVLPLSLALMGLGGCNVYERWNGEEFNAGPVDAQTFPPDYLGTSANRQRPGSGRFTARKTFVAGEQTEYFLFPLSPTQRAARDPLAVRSNGAATSAVPTPNAYVFDPGAARPGCKAPEGYSYDLVRDAVDYADQGIVFSRLPTATYAAGAEPTWSYAPIVARVPVTSQGEACQAIKSELALTEDRTDVSLPLTQPVNGKRFGIPDGTYWSYAIIEPAAAVYHAGSTTDPLNGIGLQKWGWYNQYLLAYLDGGPVPVVDEMTSAGVPVTHIVTQKLYYPRSLVKVGSAAAAAVGIGQGYDLLSARRGAAGSSPLCQVFTYDAGATLTPDQLPKSAADVETLYGATLKAPTRAYGDRAPVGDPYVYCLQLPF